ncbi:hypothetical protein Y032_0007g3221 [Ancylostoma ceylanicum]|uniref:Uncharacterized protein n=1 Tax=Ancylostoma ceylanicum TaxID=53326 RepID=A0A016VM95_9BILA|nr:hypothetical protein Y032_0007g3221 [Ancylostoma ceylanicum]
MSVYIIIWYLTILVLVGKTLVAQFVSYPLPCLIRTLVLDALFRLPRDYPGLLTMCKFVPCWHGHHG